MFILNKYIYERNCKLKCHKLQVILRQFGKSIYSINVTVFWLIYKIIFFFFIKIEILIKFSSYLKNELIKKTLKGGKSEIQGYGLFLFFVVFNLKKKWVWERKNCQNVLIIQEHINHKGTHINHRNMRGVLAFKDRDCSLCEQYQKYIRSDFRGDNSCLFGAESCLKSGVLIDAKRSDYAL